MRIVLQRVASAGVTIDGGETRSIGKGLLLLVGICPEDNEKTVAFMAEKSANLRIFTDENDAMNLSLLDVGGDAMVISNFTLYANSRKGRRPSFTEAAPPTHAEPLYRTFVEAMRQTGVQSVATGEFGADMQVSLVNDGPVTIILDSDEIMPANKK
ncbi:D-tyrosyl-tRNA(Tyr) deacylase [Ruminococcaceae bacterium OttesenSCG-928-L11]|nr:D-tyrosyl-tRNA(Tyr) deacylase [Ruminococcaceae bacterium OttesenSCG-928-L11]